MSIRVRSVALQGAGPGGSTISADGYLDKIVKSIPSQVIAFYTAAITWLGSGTSPQDNAAPNPKLWIAFVLGILLTPILTWKQTHEEGKPPAYLQIAIATVSFVVWAFAIPGPFQSFSFWSPGLATVILAAYTILIGALPQN
jgi:hypothetical protein